MSKTQTHVIYTRNNHLPTPKELTFRSGKAIVTSNAVTPPGVDISETIVDSVNRNGMIPIDHIINNPSDGKLLLHDNLYIKQIRNRWTGEIIATYDNVYDWTRRSITLLSRGTLTVDGTDYQLDNRVGTLDGPVLDTFDGKGPVNRLKVIHFPYDVEVYDPDNAGDLLGPDIDYTVQFISWDGSILKTELVKPGGTASPPAVPDRPGHVFLFWSDNYFNVQRDLIIRPIYNTDDFTVTFVNWDGTVIGADHVSYGGSATAPPDPSRIGHIFEKWDRDYTYITGNITVSPIFKPEMFKVTFVNWDGTVIGEEMVAYGTAVNEPRIPTRPNYDFIGWDRSLTGITSNQTIKAEFELHRYQIQFIDWDGYFIGGTVLVPHGQTAVGPSYPFKPSGPRPGWIFLGWNHNLANVTEDMRVMAVYDPIIYTVTYIDNTDMSVISNEKLFYGDAATPPTPPYHKGSIFLTWYCVDSLLVVTKDITAYAQYSLELCYAVFLTPGTEHRESYEAFDSRSISYGRNLSTMGLTLPPSQPAALPGLVFDRYEYINRITQRWETFTVNSIIHEHTLIYSRYRPQ